jgi:hypothetical protein
LPAESISHRTTEEERDEAENQEEDPRTKERKAKTKIKMDIDDGNKEDEEVLAAGRESDVCERMVMDEG